MRRVSLLLVGLMLAPLFSAVVSGMTPDDIACDGDLSDWPGDSLHESDANAVDFRLTWNETHLFIAWEGTDWASTDEGADLFVYLNTSEGGSPLSDDWNLAQTLPFAADFAFVLEDSTYSALRTFDGASWVDTPADLQSFIGWSGNTVTEVGIPLAALGNPTSLDLIVWSQWQEAGNVWTAFPAENPASGDGAETFTHWYHIADMDVAQAAADVEVRTGAVIDKVDDALNLAIIFHQHQPYYRNQLTGMYEMPWVRVHAMTEYVDSPGILASTDTKVTYNLVPSLMEQLLAYTNTSTLDVHTDIARRAWNDGGYPNATLLELHTMQFQSFWNSGWIYNVTADDARVGWVVNSSARYSELYDATMHNLKPATIMDDDLLPPQDFLDLQVLWYLYQFSPAYVLGDYDPAHRDEGLITLFQQAGNYTVADLTYVLDAQAAHMANVLPMYADLAGEGQVELTTTPYYHPIMPLLMMDGWTFEDGIRVNKDVWEADTRHHLTSGMDLFESEMGFRPVGMWPSEEAVSPAMVAPVADVGIEWMVTDEEILAKSKDANGAHVDIQDATNLAMPWQVDDVAVVFRDRVISDRVAWQYGSMTPEAAVSDFIAYVDDVRQQILDAGEDPSEHLLTVSMDGENWMFMSDMQHNDNGRAFTEEWFSRLDTHPTIVTTTPGEFLEENRTLPEISEIGTGSWVDGTLSTWAGEAEESLAWQRLIEARSALVAFEMENPGHAGLEDAWESVYIAEGSDWYWWYGLDQDSGYDEMWDVLFKVHLSNIYRAVGLDLPPYLQDLWTNPALPVSPMSGITSPMVDGIALPGEWDAAAHYDASTVDGGDLDIEGFYLGTDASNVYVRIDLSEVPEDWDGADVAVYFMQPNAVNFNEVQTNFRTYYGSTVLGFPAKSMVAFNFDQLREDGQAKYDLFEARGKVGEEERWALAGQSNLGGTAFQNVFEFAIPWSDVGLAPRYTTRVKVVTSWTSGSDAELAPPAPAEMVLPDLEDWITLLEMDDALDDETGDGDYTYPLASDFAPGAGLFDITHLKVSQSAWNARFEITFDEMTDFWSLSNGFSHQIVQIYIDEGETAHGRETMLEGANARVDPAWAWELALSATGEPGAVKTVSALTGETSAKGIEVQADKETGVVTITLAKRLLDAEFADCRFIIVAGSQDGFGPGKWRDVDAEAKTWRLGGGADPSPADGLDYDPNIVDMLLPEGVDQAAMLGAYDVAGQQYAVLTGIELPEVAQQIFGASVGEVTGTSAVITWSTTVPTTAQIAAAPADDTPTNWSEGASATPETTTHAHTLTGLAAGSAYQVRILVPDGESTLFVDLFLNTSEVLDETAPQIHNLAVSINGGVLQVTWYTSEPATQHIEVHGQSFAGDAVALNQNHAMTIDPYPALDALETYTLTVTVEDASGNANATSITFTVLEEEAKDPLPDPGHPDPDGPHGDPDAPGLKPWVVQLGVVVLILLGLAGLRQLRRPALDFSFDADDLFDED